MSPGKIQSLLQQALDLHRSGDLAAAGKCYRQVRLVAPKNFDAAHLSGVLALQEGHTADAVELLTRAHRLNRKSVVCQVRLAIALMEIGRANDAEVHLRDAVGRSPEFDQGWDRLAFCLRLQDRLVEAVPCHERAVALAPKSADLWHNFGLTYIVLGYPEKALPCHERALAVDPHSTSARSGRAQSLHQLHRLPEAIAEYDRVLNGAPDLLHMRSCRLFALHHVDGFTREQLFAEHQSYGRALEPAGPVTFHNEVNPGRPLKLAVWSPDLREHSCAYFLEPLLRHLDQSQFELFLYHDHFRTDGMSGRLQTFAKVWRNFSGQPSSAVEQVIRGDAPDILVDLSGHTGISNRLPSFARRLAPVQVTYLGYPDTTGVPAMDYRFTDAIADPPGEADALATESLVRFAPTAWAYSAPLDAPPPAGPAIGTPLTFGCFNTPAKWTESMAATWAQLLHRAPGSRLALKGFGLELPEQRSRYLEWFGRNGVGPERILFLERTPTIAEHLACYRGVDVALDTFPYHGTTTTCEALWMGVPVVTRIGDRHVSRVGASLLTAVGHPEWITSSAEDYVRVAAELAADTTGRQAWRSVLRQDMQRSVLLDHAGQSGKFAAALRACWAEWCARQSTAA